MLGVRLQHAFNPAEHFGLATLIANAIPKTLVPRRHAGASLVPRSVSPGARYWSARDGLGYEERVQDALRKLDV